MAIRDAATSPATLDFLTGVGEMGALMRAHDWSTCLSGISVLVVSGYAEVDGVASDLARLTKPSRRDDLAAAIAVLMPADQQLGDPLDPGRQGDDA
jgi:hypothetical protein